MAVQWRLGTLDELLLTTADDTEDAPWMVMADLQVRDVDVLKAILRLHIDSEGLPWYLASYLKVTMRRPDGRPLDVAPDLLVAHGADELRTSWNVVQEGKAPEFVLEVASDRSQDRDVDDKPRIYDAMGVVEYAIFAPERRDGGPVLFGYRRTEAGDFAPWTVTEQGILWSMALGGLGLYVEERLWLRVVDAQGQRLSAPLELVRREAAERRAAERRVAEEAAARAEADRRATEEAARRAAAEAEVARLREELRRLQAERGAPEGQ